MDIDTEKCKGQPIITALLIKDNKTLDAQSVSISGKKAEKTDSASSLLKNGKRWLFLLAVAVFLIVVIILWWRRRRSNYFDNSSTKTTLLIFLAFAVSAGIFGIAKAVSAPALNSPDDNAAFVTNNTPNINFQWSRPSGFTPGVTGSQSCNVSQSYYYDYILTESSKTCTSPAGWYKLTIKNPGGTTVYSADSITSESKSVPIGSIPGSGNFTWQVASTKGNYVENYYCGSMNWEWVYDYNTGQYYMPCSYWYSSSSSYNATETAVSTNRTFQKIDPPTISFSANSATVSFRGNSTLSWSSNGADSCTASGDWSGGKNTSGSEGISDITRNMNFTISCSGPGGTTSRSTAITLTGGFDNPTLSSPENNSQITSGTINFRWNRPDGVFSPGTKDCHSQEYRCDYYYDYYNCGYVCVSQNAQWYELILTNESGTEVYHPIIKSGEQISLDTSSIPGAGKYYWKVAAVEGYVTEQNNCYMPYYWYAPSEKSNKLADKFKEFFGVKKVDAYSEDVGCPGGYYGTVTKTWTPTNTKYSSTFAFSKKASSGWRFSSGLGYSWSNFIFNQPGIDYYPSNSQRFAWIQGRAYGPYYRFDYLTSLPYTETPSFAFNIQKNPVGETYFPLSDYVFNHSFCGNGGIGNGAIAFFVTDASGGLVKSFSLPGYWYSVFSEWAGWMNFNLPIGDLPPGEYNLVIQQANFFWGGEDTPDYQSYSYTTAPFKLVSDPFLTITGSGNGAGSITSEPAGINCPGVCAYSYPKNTPVVLNAVANSGSVFAGWSGECSGTGPCVLTMDDDKSVVATFNCVPNCGFCGGGSDGCGGTCPVAPPVNGQCQDSALNKIWSSMPRSSDDLCSSGVMATDIAKSGEQYCWNCPGICGGSSENNCCASVDKNWKEVRP